MSIEAELAARAREIAQTMRERRSALAGKKAELEAEIAAIDAEIASRDDIDERLAAFVVKIGDDYQCPYCGMYDRAQRALTPMGTGADEPEPAADAGVFRCHFCDGRYRGGGEDEPVADRRVPSG